MLDNRWICQLLVMSKWLSKERDEMTIIGYSLPGLVRAGERRLGRYTACDRGSERESRESVHCSIAGIYGNDYKSTSPDGAS